MRNPVKALLLIDLQNDFMPKGSLAVPDGFHCVTSANFAQAFFNIVIATKDWHPSDHLSFAANHPDKNAGDVIDLFGIKQTLWPAHCVQNSTGAALAKELDQTHIQHCITKGEDRTVDSYSAFFDNARRNETALGRYLQKRLIDEVYLLGVATEYCVKFSALDAVGLGLKATVIIDGCRGIGLNKHDIPHAITEMQDHGVRLLSLADLSNEL
jgi:nicotinamidase/pyrazinamidase